MDFMDLAAKRSAIRNYENKVVEEEKINKILAVGRMAPTAANRQPQRLYVMHKEEMKEVKEAINFHGCDVAILVCADQGNAWVRACDQMNAGVIDASIVTTMMMMEAVQLGLGTLWVCAFDPDALAKHCGLKENVAVINVLCLGYTLETADINRFDTTRKPLEQLVIHK